MSCHAFFSYLPVSDEVGLISAILGSVQILLFMWLFFWQVRLRSRARRGDHKATRLLVSPTYIWILLAFAFAQLFLGLMTMLSGTKPIPIGSNTVVKSLCLGLAWGIYQWTVEGLAFYLCLQGCGIQSLMKSVYIGGFVGLMFGTLYGLSNSVCSWWPYHLGKDCPDAYLRHWAFGLFISGELALFVTYLVLYLSPLSVFPRRPAAIFYARFWTLYRVFYIPSLVMMYFEKDVGYCFYFGTTWLVFGLLKPYFIYVTLRRDSSYWLGIGEEAFFARALRPSSSESNVRTPLLGTTIDPPTAQELSIQMDNISRDCRLISFVDLYIGDGRQGLSESTILGAGGTSRVFRGKFKHEDVAIKMLYCMNLTPETIVNFYQESVLLSTLKHPNIVHVEGVCVAPPTIAMVLELCKGNLYELLRLDAYQNMDWDTRLNLAIDCARSVACLHAQQPPILHMDIKSTNFLVGEEKVSKWREQDVQAWLKTSRLAEFTSAFANHRVVGSSTDPRRPGLVQLTREQIGKMLSNKNYDAKKIALLHSSIETVQDLVARKNQMTEVIKLTDLELSSLSLSEGNSLSKETSLSHDHYLTANWTAPEVLRDGKSQYSVKADVYSLGMVLWELITAQIPYDAPGDVAALVLGGALPHIPPETPVVYADLLRDTWHADPRDRPCAQEVVDVLVLMQRRLSAQQTLHRGSMVSTTSSLPMQVNEQVYVRERAAPPRRSSITPSSEFDMGSLTLSKSQDRVSDVSRPGSRRSSFDDRRPALKITLPTLPLDILESSSPPRSPEKTLSRSPSKHSRSLSDGNFARFSDPSSPTSPRPASTDDRMSGSNTNLHSSSSSFSFV